MTFHLTGGRLYREGSSIPETEYEAIFVFADGHELPLMLIEAPSIIRIDQQIFIKVGHETLRYLEIDVTDASTIDCTCIRMALLTQRLTDEKVMKNGVLEVPL